MTRHRRPPPPRPGVEQQRLYLTERVVPDDYDMAGLPRPNRTVRRLQQRIAARTTQTPGEST